jgi:RNA polymerase sigma-70 factor, ECF subfamily
MPNAADKRVSDADIIQQVLDGKVNAFEGLLTRYQNTVHRIVKKHVPYDQVEEVAHDVFIRAYQSLPNCQERDNFNRWLSAIAVRTCYDFWRKQYREREIPLSTLSEQQQHWLEGMMADQADQAFQENDAREEAAKVLDWALNQVSAEDRMVIELVYLEGLSGKEAAKLLGWSVANVKVRAFRARKKLQKILTNASAGERLSQSTRKGGARP